MQKTIKALNFIISWSIIIIPFSIAIAPGVTNTFMGFLLFAFLLKKLFTKEKLFIKTSITLPFLCLIAVSFVSFVNSVDYHSSFRGIFKLIQSILLFLICAQEIKDRKQVGRIILAITLGASLASIDALWQIQFGRDFIRGNELILNIGLKRATAAFPDANVLGVYLSAITPLIIGMALYYFKGLKKIIMLGLSALAVIGIMLTFSRGTALALYLSVLLIALCRKDKFISIALLVILLVFPFIVPQSIKDWAKEMHYNPIVLMCNTDRISMYKNAINMIKHHPVVGVGVNTFSKNYFKYKLPEPANARSGDSMYAHNHFLQMAGEIGLVGLGIFFWLLFRLFKKNIQVYKSLKDRYYKVILLSISASLFAFLINGLTETSLYYSRVAMIFWYLVGFSLSLSKFTDADTTRKN
ncbi:MAG: O-antigen ligase family protein [Candidatus Omnitrophica bacterium]|nr:O-antigen ligase family protein [Candidatus Omnitrophota bacterium]